MVEFSLELLTILTLISIAWTGITFIGIIVSIIVFICYLRSKRRRSKTIKPIATRSSISLGERSRSVSPVRIKTPQIKHFEHRKAQHDDASLIHEHSYNIKNKYQQQEYIHDENDETTTINPTDRSFRQYHHQQKRQYQRIKPMSDIRVIDRHTPYPPDVIARDKIMHSRYPVDDKY